MFNKFNWGKNARSARARKNISVGLVAKSISMLVSFLIVPITLGYVGKEEYGIWMIISSLIHWVAYLDVGLGNGLRNKLAEAVALDRMDLAKMYVSSTYGLIAMISLGLFLIFYASSFFIDFQRVFNTELLDSRSLKAVAITVFIFFCMEFTLKILLSVLQAIQLYAFADVIGIVAQILGLAGIYAVSNYTEPSLYYLCLVYASKMPLVLFFSTLILFSTKLKDYRPSINLINFKEIAPLISIGLNFFLNQILYLIFTQSSVILIAQFLSPGDVTIYNLANRYMTIANIMYMMVLTPFLTAFTEAYVKKDYDWIKRIMKKLNRLWILASAGVVVMALSNEVFFDIWVGDKLTVPAELIYSIGVLVVLNILFTKYSLFLNGIGKIRLQSVLLTFQAIVFVILSIVFFNQGFGIISTVLAQIIVSAVAAIVVQRQYKLVISQKAVGIWVR